MRYRFVLAYAIAMSIMVPARSFATCTGTSLNSCTGSCSSNCYLANNLNCTNGQGITLNTGADLDMCGHTINCSDPVACVSKAAISVTAGGTRIWNSDFANTDAGISGIWLYGIDCGFHTTSRIDHLKFTDLDFAVNNCATVENNYFESVGWPISTNTIANSDSVNDNHIVGPRGVGIHASGSHDISIDHNLIELRDGWAAKGIDVSGATDTMTVTGNVVIGDGDTTGSVVIDMPSPVFWVMNVLDNVCEPSIADCANCRTDGLCKAARPGFVFP